MLWWVVLLMNTFSGAAEGLQVTDLDGDIIESMDSMSNFSVRPRIT